MSDLILLIIAAVIFFNIWAWYNRSKNRKSGRPTSAITLLRRGEDEDTDTRDYSEYLAGQELSDVVSIETQLLLHYKDAAGKLTKRLVDVREVDIGWTLGYLSGVCHLRKAFRTFRLDRVEQCINPETGEIINIQEHLRKIYSDSPTFSMDKVLKDAYDVMRALLYIGKADGRLTRKEKEIMLQFCQSFADDNRISLADLDKVFDYYAIPSKSNFKVICGRISKLPLEAREKAVEMAAKLIFTEKRADAGEIEAINYLGKRLGLPVPEFVQK